MGMYRKKPVVIEALRWDGTNVDAILGLALASASLRRPYSNTNKSLIIETLEGEMTASLGDWIIKGVKGEIYPCKPDIFDATYEPA